MEKRGGGGGVLRFESKAWYHYPFTMLMPDNGNPRIPSVV